MGSGAGLMASRSGYMLRVDQARARASEKPCAGCGHATGDHRQIPYELYEINGTEVTVTRNPEYVSNVFVCNHDDCDCRLEVELR